VSADAIIGALTASRMQPVMAEGCEKDKEARGRQRVGENLTEVREIQTEPTGKAFLEDRGM
jgi:hypothetical protein